MPRDFTLTPDQLRTVGIDITADMPEGVIPVAVTGTVWTNADFTAMVREANITFEGQEQEMDFYQRLQTRMNSEEARATISRRVRNAVIETMESVAQ